MKTLFVSVICVAALLSPNVFAASWHDSDWSGQEGACYKEGGGRFAAGDSYFSSWFNPSAKAKLVAGTRYASRVRVRGKAAPWNEWGEGDWVYVVGGESVHDCGVAACKFVNCKASVYY